MTMIDDRLDPESIARRLVERGADLTFEDAVATIRDYPRNVHEAMADRLDELDVDPAAPAGSTAEMQRRYPAVKAHAAEDRSRATRDDELFDALWDLSPGELRDLAGYVEQSPTWTEEHRWQWVGYLRDLAASKERQGPAAV